MRIAARLSARAFDLASSGNIAAISQDHAYICSEYAYECYQSVGVTIDYDPAGFVTPADFAKTPAINALSFIQIDATAYSNNKISTAESSAVTEPAL